MNALNEDLEELKISLDAADRKIEILESRNKKLKQDLESANFKFRNLQTQMTEIDEWIGYVIKGFGPCVWVGGQFERPLPREPFKKGTLNDLITNLNKIFKKTDSPEAALLKVEDGTAYIKIFQDEKLTQRMGTFGAANYLNSIVYTILSAATIKCVDIDFEEGNHAYPIKVCVELSYL
jgi:hypothetical protein